MSTENPFHNKYSLVKGAARRARQLQSGAEPLMPTKSMKACRVAQDEIRQGRVTLNPLRHIDPVGTIVLPLVLLLVSNGQFLFGYAKPVPVAFARLKRPRRDMVDPQSGLDLDHGRQIGRPRPGEHVTGHAGAGQGGGQLPHVDVHAAAVPRAGLGERGRVE